MKTGTGRKTLASFGGRRQSRSQFIRGLQPVRALGFLLSEYTGWTLSDPKGLERWEQAFAEGRAWSYDTAAPELRSPPACSCTPRLLVSLAPACSAAQH